MEVEVEVEVPDQTDQTDPKMIDKLDHLLCTSADDVAYRHYWVLLRGDPWIE